MENRQDYIDYRFRRAEESYEDALIMVEKERWNTAMNRLYYACFYAVIALLLQKNVATKSHDGTRRQFGFLVVEEELVEKKLGKLYTKLFNARHKGDYGDLFDFDEVTVNPLVPQVREFLDQIKVLLQAK
jgi:uncharacterized protein (UPF0332 family)